MVSPLNYRLKLVIILAILAAACYMPHATCPAQLFQYIRVAIIQDTASLNLRISGPYEIRDSLSQQVLSRGKNLKTTVAAYKEGILLGGKSFNTPKIFIQTDGSGVIVIDGRRFRGDIQLIKKDNAHLMVINRIELEDYIRGILYHESSHYWPLEALKAQAIVCRSYALYQMQENRLKDYDVTSDIYSQVYGGMTSERYRTNRAVDVTEGEVLHYQGKIFPTYYHATCGGYTEDASLLWNIDIVPLKGVPCRFCQDSPHFRWHNVLAKDEIQEKLTDAGYKTNNIEDILILGKDKSGRITDLKISTDKKDISILAKDFRNIIGPNLIRSTNFKVKVVENDVVFEGFGWGHGVGLCQWGAYFMAKQGYSYKEILKYYYPGSELMPIDK